MSSKNSAGMTKLRGRMIWYYTLITFAVAVVESVIDSTYADVVYPAFYPDGDAAGLDLPGFVYLLVSLLIYAIGGVIFYRATKKALKEESSRQVREQNLVYAAIAHDLKTPMTSVQGFAKALSDGKIPAEEQPEICDIIYRKSLSMNELIDTLFEYAKFGADEYKPALEKTDICVLVRDMAAECYCDFEQRGIELEADIPDTPMTVVAEKTELKRALSNLAVNACKHNPEGIKALIRVREENGNAVVTVADTGNKIPADMDIFEPFVTENTARTTGRGSGLGLAITKRIIERQGGNITLSDGPEGYTKSFVVTMKKE